MDLRSRKKHCASMKNSCLSSSLLTWIYHSKGKTLKTVFVAFLLILLQLERTELFWSNKSLSFWVKWGVATRFLWWILKISKSAGNLKLSPWSSKTSHKSSTKLTLRIKLIQQNHMRTLRVIVKTKHTQNLTMMGIKSCLELFKIFSKKVLKQEFSTLFWRKCERANCNLRKQISSE